LILRHAQNRHRSSTETDDVRKILKNLELWEERVPGERPPPKPIKERYDEPIDDGWPGCDEPYVTVH
jgi:hypothetical protein